MLITLVAILCNGQLCLDKVVTTSEQSGLPRPPVKQTHKLVLPHGSLMVRIINGGYRATSAVWANTFQNAKPDFRGVP